MQGEPHLAFGVKLMQKSIAALLLGAFAVFGLPATQVLATVILPNLPAGTMYQLLFVTHDPTTALSSDISTYNSFASTEASLSPALDALHATWHAVGSTATINVIVNAPNNGVAVYDTQGNLLASAGDGIYAGFLQAPPQYDQYGNLNNSDVDIWTGSFASGVAASP